MTSAKSSIVAIPTNKGVFVTRNSNILYCKAEGSYTRFFLKNGDPILVAKPLRKVNQTLSMEGFVRIHNSYIINLYYMIGYHLNGKPFVTLENGIELPVSRTWKATFLDSFNKI